MSDKVSAEAPAPDLKKLELREGWLDDVIADAQQAPEAIIARLTAEVERWKTAQTTLIEARDAMEACWKREHAEVERLRAALKDIATVRGLAADLQARARAALKEPRA
jgi:uncharacterized small protein (DUF1192 family)